MAAAVLGIAFCGPAVAAAQEHAGASGELQPKGMGRFVTALCEDLHSNLWVGTEDTGVWRYDPRIEPSKRWTQFTRANTGGPPEPDGSTLFVVRRGSPDPAAPVARSGDRPQEPGAFLGDDCAYALACDKLGRVWVGHLNHGVSVFNGREWRNYDVLTGPLGERVFGIETCPVDGDVWIATSMGLTRYSVDLDLWSYHTRADGLPSDAVQCLAFDKQGTLFVGTQCDGLAIAAREADGSYPRWRKVQARWPGGNSPADAPLGQGLPTNLVNDLLVARDGTVYVATPRGLAVSADAGKTWSYTRGADWLEKAKGLMQPPSKEQLAAGAKSAQGKDLPAEDYCTSLAEDTAGLIWIGYREKGCEAREPPGMEVRYATGADKTAGAAKDFAMRLLVWQQAVPVVGWYGHGLSAVEARVSPKQPRAAGPRVAAVAQVSNLSPGASPPPHPSPAKPPTPEELGEFAARLRRMAAEPAGSRVIPLPDDWQTQGDWVGRYGRCYAVLCGASSPLDHLVCALSGYRVSPALGPHHKPDDSARAWIHWMRTEEHRSLYDPMIGTRRQSEWDDHGEAYPRTYEGPDLAITVETPEGVQEVAMYFFNKDGRTGNNRFRDYLITVHPQGTGAPAGRGPAPLARARVAHFWGGVYKRFLVNGGRPLEFRVGREYSFNTMFSAVFIDVVPATAYGPRPKAVGDLGRMSYDVPDRDLVRVRDALQPPSDGLLVVRGAWESFWEAGRFNSSLALAPHGGRLAYRAAAALDEAPSQLTAWRWRLGLWTGADRAGFKQRMAEAYQSFLEVNPHLRGLRL